MLVTGCSVPLLRLLPVFLGMTGKGHKWQAVGLGSKGSPEWEREGMIEKTAKCKRTQLGGRTLGLVMPLLLL